MDLPENHNLVSQVVKLPLPREPLLNRTDTAFPEMAPPGTDRPRLVLPPPRPHPLDLLKEVREAIGLKIGAIMAQIRPQAVNLPVESPEAVLRSPKGRLRSQIRLQKVKKAAKMAEKAPPGAAK